LLYKYGFRDYLEVKRISKFKRYNIFSTNILRRQIVSYDSASFLSQYIEIFKRGIYNFNSDTKNPYILDCGANIGLSTIYLKQIFPRAEIISFEPDAVLFKLLTTNLKHFGLDDVTIINKGLWDKDDRIAFYGKGDDAGRIITDEKANDKYDYIEVTTLRPFLKRKVDLLKIDIEGAEYNVINDISDLLPNVEKIFVEYHSCVNKPQDLDKILGILKTADFRYYIESSGKNDNPFIHRNEKKGFDNRLNIFGFR
jgi:FkbM family methyltransferase